MKEQKEGKHWYSGVYSSVGPMRNSVCNTFSVGIFKWVKKKSGPGFKKSAVIYRVKGRLSQPDRVYTRAYNICLMMDNGNWIAKGKSETVPWIENI